MSDFGKDINVPNKDIVYRQDVEDMLQNALPSRGMWEIEGDVAKNIICETVADLMMDLGKLPSAQPSGKDPIEREAVVDILHDAMQGCSESEENLIGEIVCKVDLLPSAQPEPQWIPCGKCIHADGKNRWCKVLDRTINEDYFCYWAEPWKEGETE